MRYISVSQTGILSKTVSVAPPLAITDIIPNTISPITSNAVNNARNSKRDLIDSSLFLKQRIVPMKSNTVNMNRPADSMDSARIFEKFQAINAPKIHIGKK